MRRGSPRIISCRKPQAGDKGLGVWDLNINQHRYPFLFFVWSHLLWTVQIQPRVHLAEGPSYCPLPSSPFSISLSLHYWLSFSILPTDEIPDSPPDSFHPHHHLSGMEQQESMMRVMGKEWASTWLLCSNSTRWICMSPTFHNCWQSKMDVSGIPLARNLRNVRSHGEWIALNLSGNVAPCLHTPKMSFVLSENVVEKLKWIFYKTLA